MYLQSLLNRIILLCCCFLGFRGIMLNAQSDTLHISMNNFQHFARVKNALKGFNITAREQLNWVQDSDFQQGFSALKPGLIRWPGGTKGNNYNWREGLKNPAIFNIKHLQEFIQLNNLQVDYMLNYGNTSAHEAANLVRFCNSSLPAYQLYRYQLLGDSSRLKVKYWELGNEIPNSWSFGVSWLAWDDVIRFRNGQTKALNRDDVDSMYYFGGSFMREGWVTEGGELNKIEAILGELYFPDSNDHFQLNIPVSFPRIGPDSIRIWVMVSSLKKSDFNQLNQQQIYNLITSPQYRIDSSAYSVLHDSVVHLNLPVDAFDSVTAILIEYNSIGHPGAFELCDSMKNADPSIEIGYQVNISDALRSIPSFISRFQQNPDDFMIFHMYNQHLEQMFDHGLFNEIVYRGSIKNQQHIALQSQLDSLSNAWHLPAPIGQSFTEWNLSLCETNCKPGWYGMLIAMYTANFWSAYYRSDLQDSIDIRTICHFAALASGQSPIHLFHNNGSTTNTSASEAVRMVNQSLLSSTSFLNPNEFDRFPKMNIISFDSLLNADTSQENALMIWTGIDSITMDRTLFVLNRNSNNSYLLNVDGFEAQSAYIETMKGNPALSAYQHQTDTLAPLLWPQSFSLYIDTFSLTSIHFNQFQLTHIATPVLTKHREIQIYPNPAKQSIHLTWQAGNNQNIRINIMSTDGKLLYKKNMINPPKSDLQIDISNWPPGSYFVRWQDDESTIAKQFIIIR